MVDAFRSSCLVVQPCCVDRLWPIGSPVSISRRRTMPRNFRYTVRLNAAERQGLIELVRTGRRAASTLIRARILLKADVGPQGEACDDEEIAEALATSLSTIHRVRQTFVEEGMEEA